jgi:RNA polymerase sigma-70 factor (ECF subfamily)
MREKEEEWAMLMRAALEGDSVAYRRLLAQLAPVLRAVTQSGLKRRGAPQVDAEDIVQETLLAVHLKRQTWNAGRPIWPWIAAIARHKLIDALRRRGLGRFDLSIEDLPDVPAPAGGEPGTEGDLDRILACLNERERNIVSFLSREGATAKEAAQRFQTSEGAVRVTLHRAIRRLAALYRDRIK